jgi:shikimate dehydrogenase
VLGVIGHPISHSLSPLLFTALSTKLKCLQEYRSFDVPPQMLPLWVQAHKAFPLLQGWNVTLPHKQQIVPLLDLVSKEARTLGAVNTVRKRADGKLQGYNTDVVGFSESLPACQFSKAVIFGTGGASLAAAYALAQRGTRHIQWIGRNPMDSLPVLTTHFPNVHWSQNSWQQFSNSAQDAELYVNATPVGMLGFSKKRLPLPPALNPKAWAFDMVYRPTETLFLQKASSQGLRTIPGIDMLIGQALAAWEIWFEPLAHKQKLVPWLRKNLVKQ